VSAAPKSVAIIQSSYIPWKGYFDVIADVDEFIVLDDVQFSKGSWRNRNRIKSPGGMRWLTIPVAHDRPHAQLMVDAVRVSDTAWRSRHWGLLEESYAAAPHFEGFAGAFRDLYLDDDETLLSAINLRFMTTILDVLGIGTRISRSTDYDAPGAGAQRVLNLCLAAGASRYLSGPAAQAYLEVEPFARAGIEVQWMDYDGYPEYAQLHPPFEHAVTILDLIFHTGPQARSYMKAGAA
jgi:hypothetical protein